jgi:hypothetical protein
MNIFHHCHILLPQHLRSSNKELLYRERFKKRIMPRRAVEFESDFAVAETAQLQEVGRCRRAQMQRLLYAGRTDFRITSGIHIGLIGSRSREDCDKRSVQIGNMNEYIRTANYQCKYV